VSGELLPVVENVGMGLEENIAFVRSQIDLYNTALQGALDRVTECRGRYRSKEDQLKEKQAELRSLRQALVQPSASPSRVMIETIVRLQAQLDRMTSLTDAADVSDGRQVIVSTSEPLKSILAEVGSRARVVSFVGFILQPLDGGNPNLVN
jgi:DNA repair exonuclease SbcCD ATPase subunit